MVSNTLPRDYDIARMLDDLRRRIVALEHQTRALARAGSYVIFQASDQNVASSTSLVNSGISIPITGRVKIELNARYQSAGGGGGIRWAWQDAGAVTLLSRVIGAAGATTTGTPPTTADMYWRSWVSLTGQSSTDQFNTSSTNRISEELLVEGSGTLTFQFAQDTASAVNTTLFADSHAFVTRPVQ